MKKPRLSEYADCPQAFRRRPQYLTRRRLRIERGFMDCAGVIAAILFLVVAIHC